MKLIIKLNIDIIFSDDSRESIYLPGNGDENNKWQKSYSIKKKSTLVIRIYNPKLKIINEEVLNMIKYKSYFDLCINGGK